MGRPRLLLVLCLAPVVLLTAMQPASAGTRDDPEIADPCGVGTHLIDQPAPGYHDLCAVWFETLSEEDDPVPVVRVTMAVAGDLDPRTDSYYAVSWSTGTCGYRLDRNDQGRNNTTMLPAAPTVELAVSCERGYAVPCDPEILEDLGFGCAYIPPPVYVDVSAGYREDGRTLSWTLAFDDDLAAYASQFAHGAVLSNLSAETAPAVTGQRFLLASCGRSGGDPWRCRSQTGNWALNSRDYVVGT